MAQLKIDLTTGNLAVENGSFVDATGIEEIAQHVWLRVQIILGEIVYNTKLGVPYIEEIFAQGTTGPRVKSVFRRTILDTPGVLSMLEGPELSFDTNSRAMTMTFRADTDEGELVFDYPVPVAEIQEAA